MSEARPISRNNSRSPKRRHRNNTNNKGAQSEYFCGEVQALAEGLLLTDVSQKVHRWGGRRELNPQRPEPQSGALPVELLPPQIFDYSNSLKGLLEMGNCETARIFSARGLTSPDSDVLESHGTEAD